LSYLVLLLLGMTATLLQSTLLRDVLPPYLVPDPALLLVLFASLSFPFGRGLIISFFLGLLTDLLSGAPLGWNALFALGVFAMNKGILARIFLKRSRSALGLFLLDFSMKLPYLAILDHLFGFAVPSYSRLFIIWSGELLASLLLMPFLFHLLSASLGFEKISFLQLKKNSAR
jgi:rod shape-determining protein MreD